MDKATTEQLRLSAISYVQKHPDDIKPRIAILEANIARLERKQKAGVLGKKAGQTIEENRHEMKLLRGFAETLGMEG